MAAPIEWLTGSPVVAYNLTLVASFALSAAAMFALAYRDWQRGCRFIGGLAYGFAPYRISQLPHIQMEVLWYAPLALLGLHAYIETGRRRWLVLYGAAWMLQGAANGYALVYLSVLIGLWGLWFVVLRQRWKDLVAIAVATTSRCCHWRRSCCATSGCTTTTAWCAAWRRSRRSAPTFPESSVRRRRSRSGAGCV